MNWLIHWFIPTQHNGYQAKLVTTPALAVMMLALLLVNSVLGTVPVRIVSAAIETTSLLELHNTERSHLELGPLTLNPVLSNSAQRKAQAMLDSDCWSHYCPSGKSPWDFFLEAGYDYLYAGENLAEGFFENEDVMVALMNSETHKDNIIKSDYTEIGFGIVTGTFQGVSNSTIIAVHFGTPQPVNPVITVAGSNNVLSAPIITSPQDGSVLNADELIIQGVAPDAELVEIMDRGTTWTTVDANQGIFTYRSPELAEQEYYLEAQAHQGSQTSEISLPVAFIIDRTPNEIRETQITVLPSSTESNLYLQVREPGLKRLTMTINNDTIDLTQESATLWSTVVSSQILGESTEIGVATTDLAENQWSGKLDSTYILGQADSILPLQPQATDQLQSILKSQINWVVLLLLVGLFGLDFIVLSRTGETKKGKPQLHIALLIIVAVVIVTGSFGGQIAQGLTA